jgi:dolichyl-phosphate-mannose-protein mannosyltransferase
MRPGTRRFAVALAAIALVGLGLRLLYAHLGSYGRGFSDDRWYHAMANALADGHGLTVPVDMLNGKGVLFDYSGPTVPTAFHPPLFPGLLAIASKLGFDGYGEHRALACAFGAGTVAVIGLIGRRIGGDRLGLAAAGLAAVYAPLIANDSVLMSESLFGLTIALSILAALRFVEMPSAQRAALFGAAIGLAALTRAEALLLLVLLVPFAVRRAGGRALRQALVVAGATAVVIAPWCVRNSLQFDRPVSVTVGDGAVLAGANYEKTYYGDLIGAWDIRGLGMRPPPGPERFNEARGAARLRDKGLRYARQHLSRVPGVMAARVLRTWSIYPFDPAAKVRYVSVSEARRRSVEWLSLFVGWAVMALALAGMIGLRRRGAWLAPLLATIAMVTIVSAVFYGGVRFREAADVSLVVLGGAGLLELAPRVRPRRGPAAATMPAARAP